MFTANRFTAKQCEFYKNKYFDFYKKTFAGSSMRLDFVTDADSVCFDCVMRQSSSRPFCFTDIYCDGIMILHLGEKITSQSIGMTVKLPLPQGDHRVTVYFPNLVSMSVGNFTLSDASYYSPYKPKYKFLCFGDSITQGYDADYPSLTYINKIGAHFDAEILNQAIGGELFDPDMPDEALPFSPDLITIAYGTNDWTHHTSAESFTGNARAFFDRVTGIYPGVKTVYISPVWRGATEKESAGKPIPDFVQAVSMLEGVASEYENITLVRGFELTPHTEDFYADGYLHPNDLGFSIYAERLARELEKLI